MTIARSKMLQMLFIMFHLKRKKTKKAISTYIFTIFASEFRQSATIYEEITHDLYRIPLCFSGRGQGQPPPTVPVWNGHAARQTHPRGQPGPATVTVECNGMTREIKVYTKD